ncbi:MucR family transcriptional regulator, partial [Klebsiella pneumoniae]
AEIASAYVSRNALPTEQLPNLMAEIHRALAALDGAAQAVDEVAVAAVRPSPAQIRRSVQPEALVSFIDGKSYKTLKR